MKLSAYVLSAAGVLFLSSTVPFLRSRERPVDAAPASSTIRRGLISAPGRVEAVSEEIRVGSELSGRLHSVPVEEGERIRRGQVLAQIENDDYIARVSAAEADLAERQAELLRVNNGARVQERRAAEANMRAAQAVLDNTRREAERRSNLADREMISRDQAERYQRAYHVAQAEFERASQEFSLVDADARVEDRRRAEAAVATAQAQLALARAYLAKTYIRSPLDGVVLRKLRRGGENVSTQFDSPIVTLADDSLLRVRLDIDETDVASLHLGQHVYVTAEAYGDQKFTGHIIRIGRILGRRNLRTDEPSERVDTKILETLMELDPGQKLPIGLRVDAYLQGE